MKRKTMIFLVLLMVFTITISGCGTSKTTKTQDNGTSNTVTEGKVTEEEQQEEVTKDPNIVKIITNTQEDLCNAAADVFNASRSDIQIEYQFIPTSEYTPFMNSTLGTADGPDVLMGSVSTNMWAAAGLLEPLDAYVERDNLDLDAFYPASIQQNYCNGALYGIPASIDTYAMAYNKAIFDKYNVAYPTAEWSWDDYDRIARELDAKIKAAGGMEFASGLMINSGVHFFLTMCIGNGAEFIAEDLSKSGMNDQVAVDMAEMIMALINDGVQIDLNTLNESGSMDLIISGNVGLMSLPSYNSALGKLSTSEVVDSFILLPWPKGPASGTNNLEILTTCNWAMNSGSEVKDSSWEVLKFITSQEGDKIWVEANAHLPARKDNIDLWKNNFTTLDVSVYANQLDKLSSISYPDNYLNNLMVVQANLVPMYNGEITPQEALDNLASAVNALLAENAQNN